MFETVKAGHVLLADRAYDSDALRAALTERGAWANIRAMPNRIKTFPFSHHLYRQRNDVERFFSKLKYFRAVVTRLMTSETTTSLPQFSLFLSGYG